MIQKQTAHIAAKILCNKKLGFRELFATERANLAADFFDLTTAELLVAQSLGEQYQFAFVNTITGNFMELTINQVYVRAKKIYPK